MCHLSLTPRTYWEVISDRQRTGPRESHPSEDLSELPPLRDPATRWFPNVMDYSDLKQGCGWTGVPLCPFPVMAAPGAARFLQAAVTRSYRTGLYARPITGIKLGFGPFIEQIAPILGAFVLKEVVHHFADIVRIHAAIRDGGITE